MRTVGKPVKLRCLLLLCCGMGIILSSCSSPVGDGSTIADQSGEFAISITATPAEQPRYRQLGLPFAAPSIIPDPTPTTIPTSLTAVPNSAKIERFHICSPLAEQSLSDLSKIISDPYHPPPPGREERHHGVDFAYYNRNGRASILGETVQAVLQGRVAASIVDRFPYGNMVIVETPVSSLNGEIIAKLKLPEDQSLYILYAHLDTAPLVKLNENVTACQPLGAAGKSGNAGGGHLHIETRTGPPGVRFESMAYYKLDASEEERAAYVRWRIGGEFVHFDPMSLLR